MVDIRWQARVDTPDGVPLGGGLLIGDSLVLTCAHVIDGLTNVRVTLPGVSSPLPAMVTRRGPWTRTGDPGDIAVLQLRQRPKVGGCSFAPPDALRPRPGETSFELQTRGFPYGHDKDGRYVTLRTSSDQALRGEWLQVNVVEPHLPAINQGFSGAPVWLPGSGEVVGMITDADLGSDGSGRIGRMLPLSTVRRYWDGLDEFLPRSWTASGLGDLLFEARIREPAGQLITGFGPDNTLIVTGQDASLRRWSLEGPELSGMPPGERLPSGIHTAVSSTEPTVAFLRDERLTIARADRDGYRITHEAALKRFWPTGGGITEFLCNGTGKRFVTRADRRISARDFHNGSVAWHVPSRVWTTGVAIDPTGTSIAVAERVPPGLAGHKITVATEDGQRLFGERIADLPVVGSVCMLALFPDAQTLACASYREVILARPHTGETVFRRRLGTFRRDVVPAFALRPKRLICAPGDTVLWLRGWQVMVVDSAEGEPRSLLGEHGAGDEPVHDIAFDYAEARLAVVYESGLVRVWQWNPAFSYP